MLGSSYVLMGVVKLFELLAGLVLCTQKDIIIMVVISVVLYLTDKGCLLYTSPSPRDDNRSRMPSSA